MAAARVVPVAANHAVQPRPLLPPAATKAAAAPPHHHHHHHHPRWQQLQQHMRQRGRHPHGPLLQPPASSFLDDPIEAAPPKNPDPSLVNDDLLPVPASARTLGTAGMAALWITLVISITTFYLAASLVELGMSWSQGLGTVLAGNLIVLLPMVLSAHPGTRYGLPFPVLARASFGIRGANLPALARALVACAWFGLQTHIGGASIEAMLQAVATGGAPLQPTQPLPLLGISAPQLGCFLVFWAAQVAVVVRGMHTIKTLELLAAPILVALSLALLAWAWTTAGGLGPMLAAPSQFGPGMPQAGRFWAVALPAVTANVGYWATLALNISDLSRFATSQRAQAVGQTLGLPTFMAAFSFIGLAVTSATVQAYGAAIRDPVQLLSKLQHPAAICLALFGLMLATLTTNIAANVIAPANAFVNAAPRTLTFTRAALLTAAIGLLMQPWRLYGSFLNFLVAYSVLLGPVVGVVLADYYLVRRRQLDMDGLFSADPRGPYWYQGGVNRVALAAVACGVAPCLPGLLASVGLVPPVGPLLAALYDCAWFVGIAIATGAYSLGMLLQQQEPGGAGRPAPSSAA